MFVHQSTSIHVKYEYINKTKTTLNQESVEKCFHDSSTSGSHHDHMKIIT